MNVKILLAMSIFLIVLMMGCKTEQTASIVTNFEECVSAGNPVAESYPRQCVANGQMYTEEVLTPEQDVQLIGGQRDEHGCLGPAGYSWDEEIGACTRQWELNEAQKQVAKLAVAKIGQTEGLTVVEVLPGSCEECYTVTFDTNQEQTVVEIKTEKAD